MTAKRNKRSANHAAALFVVVLCLSYLSVPRGPSSHNPSMSSSFFHCFCLRIFLSFCPSLFSFHILSSLCAICLPSVSPVTPQTVFVKDGEDHRGFLSIWPRCALHLPLTAWSITHNCFLLLFGSRLLAHGSTCLSLSPSHYYCEPYSVGNKPTYLHFLCTTFFVVVYKTPLNLKAHILSDIVIQELYDLVKVIHKEIFVIKAIV